MAVLWVVEGVISFFTESRKPPIALSSLLTSLVTPVRSAVSCSTGPFGLPLPVELSQETVTVPVADSAMAALPTRKIVEMSWVPLAEVVKRKVIS